MTIDYESIAAQARKVLEEQAGRTHWGGFTPWRELSRIRQRAWVEVVRFVLDQTSDHTRPGLANVVQDLRTILKAESGQDIRTVAQLCMAKVDFYQPAQRIFGRLRGILGSGFGEGLCEAAQRVADKAKALDLVESALVQLRHALNAAPGTDLLAAVERLKRERDEALSLATLTELRLAYSRRTHAQSVVAHGAALHRLS